MSLPWTNLPVVRNASGKPVANAVRPINRSEVVRRIFQKRGNLTNGQVGDLLATEGIEVSASVINVQRERIFPNG